MILPPLEGLSEVRGAVVADPDGRVRASTPGAKLPADAVVTATSVLRSIAAAGETFGFGRLETLSMKGPTTSLAVASRPDQVLLVTLDPFRGSKQVDAVMSGWARSAATALPPPLPAVTAPPPAPPPRAAPAAATPAAAAPAPDPWAALRRALVRGHLTEAVAHQRELTAPVPPGPRRPGAEPVSAEACERTLQVLLEGIGSVMAGDGVGGDRILRPLAGPSEPNLSFRWLALHWSARAALKRGAFPTARAHVKESLDLGRQLDIEARAVSQWIAAEVLSHDSDPTRALAWLAESRSRFDRLGDGWGLGQTWLVEARILAALQREPEAIDAARRAAEIDPTWDEPPVFLARRALLRDDLAAAEELLNPVATPAADRLRALIGAIRDGTVSRPDAAEYLCEHDAPPSPRSIGALSRIAGSSPRFVQAREALAWMLLKIGKYAEAGGLFRALLSQQLGPGDRASVMLGLGCIANAQQGAGASAPPIRAVVAPSAPAPVARGAGESPPAASSSIIARAGQAASGALDAVFSGRLSVFALPDLLEFLRSARRTGLLVCSAGSGMGALRFRDGWITGAASPATPGVADLLVRAQKLSPAAARAAVAAGPEQGDQALGERLVREGLIGAEAVQEALEQQVTLTIRELVSWREGEFAFNREAEGEAGDGGLAVSVDPQAVLLNVFKDLDEAARGPVPADAKP